MPAGTAELAADILPCGHPMRNNKSMPVCPPEPDSTRHAQVPLPFFLRSPDSGIGWSRSLTGAFLAIFIIV